jgi:hypothetical protein
MAEAMQAITPIMQKQMQGMTERLQQEVAQMIREPKSDSNQAPSSKPN